MPLYTKGEEDRLYDEINRAWEKAKAIIHRSEEPALEEIWDQLLILSASLVKLDALCEFPGDHEVPRERWQIEKSIKSAFTWPLLVGKQVTISWIGQVWSSRQLLEDVRLARVSPVVDEFTDLLLVQTPLEWLWNGLARTPHPVSVGIFIDDLVGLVFLSPDLAKGAMPGTIIVMNIVTRPIRHNDYRRLREGK